METIGNIDLLKLHKTAFLCSRKVSASVVLKCYDWDTQQRDAGHCVISGFHSQLEKDVLHFLLKGTQPIILVLARGMKKRFEPEIEKALSQNRMLIISPFEKEIIRVSEKTAQVRNRLMVEIADSITVGFFSKGGLLEELIQATNIEVNYL